MAKKKPYQRAERQRRAARQAELEAHRRQRIVISVTAAVSVLAVIGAMVALATRGGPDDPAAQPSNSGTPSASASPETPASIPTVLAPAPKRPTPLPAQVKCTFAKSAEPAAKKVQPPTAGTVSARGTAKVTLTTTVGKLNLTLDRSLAPCAVHSFLSLVKQKYFDAGSCHRMTTAGLQVLQCGDPSGTGSGGPGYSFADEVYPTLKYGRGILAMANSGPNTNGSQFFIVYGTASGLEPKYSAFGTLDQASVAIVDSVARAGVTSRQPGSGDGKPVTPVGIQTAVAG